MEIIGQVSTVEYDNPSSPPPSNFKRKHEAMLAQHVPSSTDSDTKTSAIVQMLTKTRALHEAQNTLVQSLRADASRHQHEELLRTSLLEVASLYTLNGALARQRIGEVVAVAISSAIDAGRLSVVTDCAKPSATDKAPKIKKKDK